MGVDPGLSEEVWLRIGRFGPYIQRGSGDELKRVSVPETIRPADVDLETALKLLALPREVGLDADGDPIMAGINRYGPFVQRGRTYARLDADDDVLTIGMNRALSLLEEKGGRGGRRAGGGGTTSAGKTLGEHPQDGKPIELRDGRFGPYLKWNKLNASLPKGTDPDALDFDEAVEILAQKAAKTGAKPAAKSAKGKARSSATGKNAKSASGKGTSAKSASGKSAGSKSPGGKTGGSRSGGKTPGGGRQTGS